MPDLICRYKRATTKVMHWNYWQQQFEKNPVVSPALLVGSWQQLELTLLAVLTKAGISSADIVVFNENPGKIETLRSILKEAYFSPFNSQAKVLIIAQADALTPEAQNALLKTLEEPSPTLTIILVAPSEQLLLPTIQSRVQVYQSDKTAITPSAMVKEFWQLPLGDRLFWASQNHSNIENIDSFLDELIVLLAKSEDVTLQTPQNLLQKIYRAKSFAKSNVSTKVILEYCAT